MNKVLRINMTNMSVKIESVKEDYKRLGGRGLTSTIIFDEVKPTCHPLGEENKLIIAPGLLAGTYLSSSNRLSVGAKSPLTGGIKESNSGGNVAFKLAKLGIKAIIIEGKPQKSGMNLIYISKDGVSIEDANFIKNLNTYEATKQIQSKFGKDKGIMVIGPAGEMKLTAAQINVTDIEGYPSRSLGRGGMGAVMGSKGIKAIIVDDSGVAAKSSEEVNKVVKNFAKQLKENLVTGELFAKFGTARNVMGLNILGGLPTRNFTEGKFEKAEDISGEKLYETIVERGGESKVAHSCMPGCVIRCSKNFLDTRGEIVANSFEYETLCLLGSNIGIGKLDEIAVLNRLCDEYGVDTMEIGGALGVLAEAGVIEFGDFEGFKKAIEEVGNGSPFGRLIGSGSVTCGRAYGIERIPAVKNQTMAAYDPRVIKGNGVTYATSPMGADHTAGNTIIVADVVHNDPKGKVELSRDIQINMTMMDILGMCIFTGRVSFTQTKIVEEAVKDICGFDIAYEELQSLAKSIILKEREFNRRAGFNEADDRLPEFMLKEPIKPFGDVFDIDYNEMDKIFD
ncbi:MAG: aldehyde:ferredoxin oxidoreductase [Thermoanaerobacteraceae bacterium]|nr:aldehyde:ferredoxin oxidoreductase [Thermoanaerobacteraceae bacterium]